MFKSLKLYTGGSVDLEYLWRTLVDFGYKRQEQVSEEGDFSRRGGVIDIFPFTFELPIRMELEMDKIASIKAFEPASGRLLWEHKIVIILPLRRHLKTTEFTEEFPLKNFVDLELGDYVVHSQYGIGRFRGLQRMKTPCKDKDYLVIEYEGEEKLYVPTEEMHLVQKYIAFHTKRPRLYRLGTKQWQRTKERARKGIQRLAWELLSLQAMRMSIKGFSYSADSEWQKEFEKTFPYKETPGQLKATAEVKRDMESSKPMDRLLCGDVGYGKTEVAMRAAFKAVMDNKQVAYLVPTTILAEQHYQNFCQRLKAFPINVRLLCRFKTKGEQRKIIEEIATGGADIVIGTHRLLSGDVRFKDLGLVIIDEEQRFGVKAKEKLKILRLSIDVITLSATPIPRTLYMGLMQAKDLSLIDTPVQNRLPIKTIVVEYDEDLIRQAILRELHRQGQVYFLHNRIQDIEKIKERLLRLLPANVRVAVAHGQMPAKSLEKIMLDFLNARIDILVCTQIVESGLDIPNVNTIMINNAHTFGLSDLHQLRGRVGRFNRNAYAYFIVPKNLVLEREAKKRLETIHQYSQLGSGFKIAMEDLELRGAGNLLGVEQHGFISAVGFDLYCRLLREAIANFKKTLSV